MLGFIDLLTHPGYSAAHFLLLFVRELGIGLVIGVVLGAGAVEILKRVHLATDGLYPVASLTVCALAYGGADTLHGSGFLAVYLAGLAIGRRRSPLSGRLSAFTRGSAGSPRSQCSSPSTCSCFPVSCRMSH